MERPSASFVDLATELKYMIVARLSDVSSLRNLIHSSSTFYHSFKEAPNSVLVSLLSNGVGEDLVHEAVASFEANNLSSYTHQNISTFLDGYFGDHMEFGTRRWSMRAAEYIMSQHAHVIYFTERFFNAALSVTDDMGIPHLGVPRHPLSDKERTRIMRTFYRFEIFCSLFRVRDRYTSRTINDDKSQQLSEWIARFPPWENEQMACVRLFLHRILSEPMKDVAAHNPGLGWLLTPPRGLPQANDYKEWILSRGLNYLHEFYEVEDSLMRLKMLDTLRPDSLFLDCILDTQLVGDDLEQVQRILTERTSTHHEDEGPRHAWAWAYGEHIDGQAQAWNECLYSELREVAYVMWDDERLQDWGILDRYTHEIRYDKYDTFVPETHSDTDSCPSTGRGFDSDIEEENWTERGWGDYTSPLTPDFGDDKMTQASKAQNWGSLAYVSDGPDWGPASAFSCQQDPSDSVFHGKRTKSKKPLSKNARERSYWGLCSFEISDKLGNLKLKHAHKRSHSAPPGPRTDISSTYSRFLDSRSLLYESKDGSYGLQPVKCPVPFDEVSIKQILMNMTCYPYEMD